MSEVRTFCRVCTAACGIVVTVEPGPDGPRVTRVKGDHDHPLSQGYTCPKGRALPALHHHPNRLEYPVLRRPGSASGQRVGWNTLLDDLAERMRAVIDRCGPDGVALFLGTASAFDTAGRRTCEQLLKKLGSRQKYTSLTVDAVAKVFIAELMGGWWGLNPIWDETRCPLLLVLGHNPVVSHGHANAMSNPRRKLREQRRRGELWVADPRSTETAELATRHLRTRPGSDYALVGFLVREILRDGADRDFLAQHANGLDELAAAVEPLDIDRAAAETGVSRQELAELLQAVRRAGRLAVLTGTGVDMAATGNVTEWLVWALEVITGSFDRPGGMWFNPGFLIRADTRPRKAAPPEGLRQPGPASRPDLPGRFGERPSAAIVSEIEAGNIGALLVMGGNPLLCLPDTARTRAALAGLDVLAVSDVVETETTRIATHVLPATGQLERADLPLLTDTFHAAVMSQFTAPLVPPVAERKPLWWSLGQLARRLDADLFPDADLDALTDRDVIAPIIDNSVDGAALTSSPTAVIGSGPVFGWVTERILPDRRWRLAPTQLVEQLRDALTRPAPVGLTVTVRRTLRTMNSQLRDACAPGEVAEEPEIWINPGDAADAGVLDGARIKVASKTGSTSGRARLTVDVAPGTVSMTNGWDNVNVCALTTAEHGLDPLTGMPLQTAVPVEIIGV
ncbi:MAG TPA: molybdopterin-dependent oxidoreductase [Mycobacteriales bacterium]|nr:molybdopterin-dependent oxidoreductase [Mycobacteriales bacterium]